MNAKPLAELISKRGFDKFQPGLVARFKAFHLNYGLTYGAPTDNPAMCLDFESPLHLGRVIVWESGECDLEVLEVSSGKTVLLEHHQLNSEIEFHHLLPKVALLMRDAMDWPRPLMSDLTDVGPDANQVES